MFKSTQKWKGSMKTYISKKMQITKVHEKFNKVITQI
jgi:hypothetical protein